jgi:uncharacterized protein YidB (DUF937 family)
MSDLLGSILSQVLGGSGGSGRSAGGDPLMAVLAQMLGGGGQGGGQQAGGLDQLLQQLQGAGMGRELDSWISKGDNLPVNADQLSQAFGRERMQDMARQAGMDSGGFGDLLAQVLPQAIDRMSPEGRLPEASSLDAAMADIGRMLPR